MPTNKSPSEVAFIIMSLLSLQGLVFLTGSGFLHICVTIALHLLLAIYLYMYPLVHYTLIACTLMW